MYGYQTQPMIQPWLTKGGGESHLEGVPHLGTSVFMRGGVYPPTSTEVFLGGGGATPQEHIGFPRGWRGGCYIVFVFVFK